MSKETGGPAFPVSNEANVNDQMGMTLRDYFAAKALLGYRTFAGQWFTQYRGEFADPEKIAEWSYRDADAMLAERAK